MGKEEIKDNVFCDECKFFLNRFWSYPRCTNRKAYRYPSELVHFKNFPLCKENRAYDSPCGSKGKLFEQKEIKKV